MSNNNNNNNNDNGNNTVNDEKNDIIDPCAYKPDGDNKYWYVVLNITHHKTHAQMTAASVLRNEHPIIYTIRKNQETPRVFYYALLNFIDITGQLPDVEFEKMIADSAPIKEPEIGGGKKIVQLH